MFKYISALFLVCSFCQAGQQANGIKIGEVSQHEATVWVRVTENAQAANRVGKWNVIPRAKKKLESLPYTVAGASGEVRVVWWRENGGGKEKVTKMSSWVKVTEQTDYTHKFKLSELDSGQRYFVEVEARENEEGKVSKVEGTFVTAFGKDQVSPVKFNVITCQGFWRRDTKGGHEIYSSMQNTKPHFLVHTGDVIYYDKPLPYAKDVKLARYKWNRIYALPKLRDFHAKHSCYYLKDDHDVLKNDAWSGQTYGELSFARGQELFREQTTFPDKTPYRTVRWGKHVQIWLMEGRDFRTPNNHPDPKKRTIWGEEQIKWLAKTLEESDATFKFIISPTPIVGPDRTKGKSDNHANQSHQVEGDKVRKLLSSIPNTYVLCGDRHWQYASFDTKTKLKEFGCGPASDIHASGYSLKERKENHTYLKISGGFLSVTVSEKDGEPTAEIQHRDTKGEVVNSVLIPKK